MKNKVTAIVPYEPETRSLSTPSSRRKGNKNGKEDKEERSGSGKYAKLTATSGKGRDKEKLEESGKKQKKGVGTLLTRRRLTPPDL